MFMLIVREELDMASADRSTLFINATILDGSEHMEPQPDMAVTVERGVITWMGPSAVAQAPAGAEVIDLGGAYLMPGLINMHVHLADSGKIQKKQRDLETLVRRILSNPVSRAVAYRMVCSFARTELLGGVTTIRTVGGLDTFDTRLRDEIRAGRRIGDIANAIQTYCERRGYTVVREMCGHGIGRKMHEDPEVPNYGRRGTGALIRNGLCIAIEPMINLGSRNIVISQDGWTCRTKDRKPSAHYEHTVAVVNDEAEVLTTFEPIREALGERFI